MNKKDVNRSELYIRILGLLPIIFIIAIVPLIVSLKVVYISDIEKVLWNYIDTTNDFFNKYKSEAFIGGIALALIFTSVRLLIGDLKFKVDKWLFPVGIYGLLIVISTFMMKYKDIFADVYEDVISDVSVFTNGNISLRGFWDRYEGFYILVGYIVITFIVFITVENTKQVDILIVSILMSSSIISVIAIFQFFGYDFFQSQIGLKLMVPEMYASIRDQVIFNFGKYTSYSTLYNPNYVGGYMALVFPFAVAFFIKAKNRVYIFVSALVCTLIFSALISSNSTTGFIAFLVASVVMFVLGFGEVKKNKLRLSLLALTLILSFSLLNIYSGSLVFYDIFKIEKTFNEKNVDVTEPYIHKLGDKEELIVNMSKTGYGARIETESIVIIPTLVDNKLFFFDDQQKALTLLSDAEKLYFEDDGYEHISFQYLGNNEGIQLNVGRKKVSLYFLEGQIEYIGNGGRLFQPGKNVRTFGFEGNEYFGNSRGYIWSRTIPMLEHTIFVGTGPDTFATVFPHYDLVGKANYLFNTATLPDKPHNMYLQMAINTGVLSLLIFLIISLSILTRNALVIWRFKEKSSNSLYYIAMSGSVVAYLVAGLGNDSVISISAIFWTLIGVNSIMLSKGNKFNFQD